MADRVLWLDNDPAYVYPFQVAMQDNDIEVTTVRTVSEASAAIDTGSYDVVIIDIMIPVTESEEAAGYSGAVTDDSHKTGLEFYRRNKERLAGAGSQVLAMTVRVDRRIRDEFIAAGLTPVNFVSKMELRDASAFVARIKQALLKRRTEG